MGSRRSARQTTSLITYFVLQIVAPKFDSTLSKIRENAPEETMKYLEKNWLNGAEVSTSFERLLSPNFRQKTTNIAESKNGKLKKVSISKDIFDPLVGIRDTL